MAAGAPLDSQRQLLFPRPALAKSVEAVKSGIPGLRMVVAVPFPKPSSGEPKSKSLITSEISSSSIDVRVECAAE